MSLMITLLEYVWRAGGDGNQFWSPIKLSRTCVRAASESESNGGSSDVELKPPEVVLRKDVMFLF